MGVGCCKRSSIYGCRPSPLILFPRRAGRRIRILGSASAVPRRCCRDRRGTVAPVARRKPDECPLPSIEMRTPDRRSRSVQAKDVNWPALVGVHDLGRPEAGDGLVQRLDAEVRLQRIRDPLGQNLTGVPGHLPHTEERCLKELFLNLAHERALSEIKCKHARSQAQKEAIWSEDIRAMVAPLPYGLHGLDRIRERQSWWRQSPDTERQNRVARDRDCPRLQATDLPRPCTRTMATLFQDRPRADLRADLARRKACTGEPAERQPCDPFHQAHRTRC